MNFVAGLRHITKFHRVNVVWYVSVSSSQLRRRGKETFCLIHSTHDALIVAKE